MAEKIVSLDFDGVIMAGKPFDPSCPGDCTGAPVPGMPELIRELFAEGWTIEVTTVRAITLAGRKAVVHWLNTNGCLEYVARVSATRHFETVHVDALAIPFNGDVSGLDEKIRDFVPWNRGV